MDTTPEQTTALNDTVIDTQEVATTSLPNETTGHDDSIVSDSAPQVVAPENQLSEEEFTRLKSKAQKLEKDYAQKVKEAQALEEKFERVSGFIAEDPELTVKALVKTSGMTEAEAKARVEELRQQGYWQKPAEAAEANVPFDPEKAVTDVLRKQEEKRIVDKWVESDPSLKEVTPENSERFKKAYYLAKSYQSVNPSLGFEEALFQADSFVTGKNVVQQQEALQNAEYAGMSKVIGANLGAGGGEVSQAAKPAVVNLTQQEREYAQALGMSEENYAKNKGGGWIQANI